MGAEGQRVGMRHLDDYVLKRSHRYCWGILTFTRILGALQNLKLGLAEVEVGQRSVASEMELEIG